MPPWPPIVPFIARPGARHHSAVAVALTHRGRHLVAAGIVSNVETFRDIALVHVRTNDGSDLDPLSAVARDQEQED